MSTHRFQPSPRPQADHPLWSIQETATYLGVPVATLYKWRHHGTGPTSFRVGRWLRYDPAVIRQWLDAQVAA